MERERLKERRLKNFFVHRLRIEIQFDDNEYEELCDLLRKIIVYTKNVIKYTG